MLGLISLPYEVLANIVGGINFDDVFNLALTCKNFKYLIIEESICKSIMQVS
jgi:F-box domain